MKRILLVALVICLILAFGAVGALASMPEFVRIYEGYGANRIYGFADGNGNVLMPPEFSANDIATIERLLRSPADVVVPANVETLHWHEVRRLLPARQYMEVFDIRTGTTYIVRSFSHGNHADVETINAHETAVHLSTFGGVQTWSARPVWVTFQGRTFIGAIHSMQHAGSTISGNNMNGHICLHFYRSTNNGTNRPIYWPVMDVSINYARFAGVASWLRSFPPYVAPYIPHTYVYVTQPWSSVEVRIRVDGGLVYIPEGEQPPVIVDGRALVPVRAVMEVLGFEVYWDEDTRTITLHPEVGPLILLPTEEIDEVKGFQRPDSVSGIHIPGNMYTSNMGDGFGGTVWGQVIPMGIAPQMINNRVMVPVRAIVEATGMVVEWDGENMIVDIITE